MRKVGGKQHLNRFFFSSRLLGKILFLCLAFSFLLWYNRQCFTPDSVWISHFISFPEFLNTSKKIKIVFTEETDSSQLPSIIQERKAFRHFRMKSAILILIKYEKMQTFAFSLGDFKLLFVSNCICKSSNKNLKASVYIIQHSPSLNIFTIFSHKAIWTWYLYVLKALYTYNTYIIHPKFY